MSEPTEVHRVALDLVEVREQLRAHVQRSEDRHQQLLEAIGSIRADLSEEGRATLSAITPAVVKSWLPVLFPILAAIGGSVIGGGVVDMAHEPGAALEHPAEGGGR